MADFFAMEFVVNGSPRDIIESPVESQCRDCIKSLWQNRFRKMVETVLNDINLCYVEGITRV